MHDQKYLGMALSANGADSGAYCCVIFVHSRCLCDLYHAAGSRTANSVYASNIGLGVQCLYCHPGALRGPSPGLPTLTKCWGCHQNIAKTDTSPRLAVLKDYVLNNREIAWVPVSQVPDFVHFTHRPHIAAGLNCEQCHGDMSNVEIARNPQVMNMGWCLDCHRERAAGDPEKVTKLTDCGTCHY
jgi:hypothetical protein